MAILIFRGKNDFLTSELAYLMTQKFEGQKIVIENEEEWSGLKLRQEGLFNQGGKKVVFAKNQLRLKNKKNLETLRNRLDSDHLIFIENNKGEFFCPRFIKQKARIYDVDVLSRRYSFWKKIAEQIGTSLTYSEFQEAAAFLGDNIALLWTMLEQKAVVRRPLTYLLQGWSWGNIFRFVEAIHKKSLSEALEEIRSLRINETEPLQVWYLLVNEFVRLYQLKNNIPINAHPFVKQKLKEKAYLYNSEELERILDYLYELDTELKIGFLGRLVSRKQNWEVIFCFVFWWFSAFASMQHSSK